LCVDCGRKLWHSFVERKIAYFNADFLDWLLIDWSKWFVHRDAAPVRYWIQIGTQSPGCMSSCCDIWVVAAKHLSIR
jgi:hypothetical protein